MLSIYIILVIVLIVFVYIYYHNLHKTNFLNTVVNKGMIEKYNQEYIKDIYTSKIPVLAFFWINNCPACRYQEKILDEIYPLYNEKIKIIKININENKDLVSSLFILKIPEIMFFKDGKLVENYKYTLSKEQIIKILKEKLEIEII